MSGSGSWTHPSGWTTIQADDENYEESGDQVPQYVYRRSLAQPTSSVWGPISYAPTYGTAAETNTNTGADQLQSFSDLSLQSPVTGTDVAYTRDHEIDPTLSWQDLQGGRQTTAYRYEDEDARDSDSERDDATGNVMASENKEDEEAKSQSDKESQQSVPPRNKGRSVSFGEAHQASVTNTHYPAPKMTVSSWITGGKPGKHAKRRSYDSDRHLKVAPERLQKFQSPAPQNSSESSSFATHFDANDVGDLDYGEDSRASPSEGALLVPPPHVSEDPTVSESISDEPESFSTTETTTPIQTAQSTSRPERFRTVSYSPSDGLKKKLRKTSLSSDSVKTLSEWSTRISRDHDTLDMASWMRQAGFYWPEGESWKGRIHLTGDIEPSTSVLFKTVFGNVDGLKTLDTEIRRELTKEAWATYSRHYKRHVRKKSR